MMNQGEYKISQIGKNWKRMIKGFYGGHYHNFNQDTICYLNDSQYVRMYKDQHTSKLLVERFYVYPKIDGTIVITQPQKFDFGFSDQIRIFKKVSIAMDYVGSIQLSNYMKVSERNGLNQFYFTYDFQNKEWKGIWGMPKKNWKLYLDPKGNIKVSQKWKAYSQQMLY